MRALLGCLLLLVLPGRLARAGEEVQGAALVAERVAAAFAAGDVDGLRALATREPDDPWIVTEVLCGRERLQAAAAYAAAVPPDVRAPLVAYVADDAARQRTPCALPPALEAEAVLHAGDPARALRLLDSAATDAGTLAAALGALVGGRAQRALGRPREAAASYASAASLAEALGWLAGASRAAAGSGDAAFEAGELAASLLWRDRRLELDRRRGDGRGVFEALVSIAAVHERLGDHASALAYREQALGAQAEGEDDGAVVALRAATARSLSELGRYDAALELLDLARTAAEEARDSPGQALVLEQVAAVHARASHPDEALAALAAARTIHDAAGDRLGRARVLAAEGAVERSRGHHERSAALLEEALAVFRAEGDRARSIAALWSLGLTARERGDFAGALSRYEVARKEAEDLSLGELLVQTWRGEADAALALGDERAAADTARRAVAALPAFLGGLSEEQGASAREENAALFEVGGRAGVRLGDEEMLCFFLESGRAGTLLEFLGHRDALEQARVPDALLAEEAETRAAEAAALERYRRAMDAGNRRETRKARAALETARDVLKQAIERIQRHVKSVGSALLEEPAPLAEIRGWLGEGEALVLYGLYREEAVALVVTRDGRRIVPLGPSARIVDACGALAAGDPTSDPARALQALRDLLITPLALPATYRRLLISPDGVLAYLPFAAVVPDLELAFLPSATTYGLLREDRARRGEGVLALGDPLYNVKVEPTAQPSVRCGVSLVPLPASREEALAVGDVVLLGSEATEAGFRYAVGKRPRWSSVHIACHGLMNAEKPTLSCLALTTQGDDDGFLTALDVFRLRIPADLVVLSACDSGRGRVVGGEGVLGLMRAFLFAGSPRVVVSLDKVDDQATGALMRRFYELWKGGASTAAALQGAQAFVRSHAAWRHPYFWATWVLWGLPD